MDHPNRRILLPGSGEELNIPLSAMVADYSKAGNAVGLPGVIQNIREFSVHLVDFTGLRGCTGDHGFLAARQTGVWPE